MGLAEAAAGLLRNANRCNGWVVTLMWTAGLRPLCARLTTFISTKAITLHIKTQKTKSVLLLKRIRGVPVVVENGNC